MIVSQYVNYEWAQTYFIGVFLFSFIFAAIPFFLSKSVVRFEKNTPYECGVEPFGHLFQYVNIQFFVVAVLFLIFDLEIIFLLPWVVNAAKFSIVYGTVFFIPFYVFMVFMVLGYIYEWLVGALDWTFGNLKN